MPTCTYHNYYILELAYIHVRSGLNFMIESLSGTSYKYVFLLLYPGCI